MKKLILLLALVAMTVNMFAAGEVTLKADTYYYSYTGAAADTSISGVVWNKAVIVNKATPVYYNIAVTVDEVTAGSCPVIIQGKIFDGETYTPIDTLTATSDTTLYFTQNTTASFYRYINIQVKAGSGKFKTTAITEYYKH
jgi:hypothetical protein